MIKFIKFGFIGIINTAITIATYAVLVYAIDMNYLAANITGYLLGMVNSYIWNKNWVFKVKESYFTQYVKFIVVNLLMLSLNSLGLFLLVDTFHINKMVAQIFVICFVTVINFILTKKWTFSTNRSIN